MTRPPVVPDPYDALQAAYDETLAHAESCVDPDHVPLCDTALHVLDLLLMSDSRALHAALASGAAERAAWTDR